MRQSARFDDSAYTSSLHSACKAAIIAGNHLTDIRPEAWARTYRCGSEEVREAWESALTELSQQPQNSFDVEGNDPGTSGAQGPRSEHARHPQQLSDYQPPASNARLIEAP